MRRLARVVLSGFAAAGFVVKERMASRLHPTIVAEERHDLGHPLPYGGLHHVHLLPHVGGLVTEG